MAHLLSLWENYLTGGKKGLHPMQLLRLKFINAFSLVGFVSFIVFGLMNALGDNAHTGYAELFFAFLAALNVVYVRGSSNANIGSTAMLVVMFVAFVLLLCTGGIANTGWLWVFTLPPLAFFLKGRRGGWWYIAAMLIAILLLSLGRRYFGVPFAYSTVEARQFIASFLAPVLLIYFYVRLSEWQSQELENRTNAAEMTNRELKSEIEKRNQAESAIQNQNEFLENVKTATLNILEDLKKEKDAAETANFKNEALLESIGEGIVAIDENLHIIAINHAAEEILAVNTKKALGKDFYDFWGVADESGRSLELKERPIYQALHGKKIISNRYSYTRPDGKKIPISIVATPIRIGKKITGVIAAFRDIAKEREIDRAKTEFVSLASHQLRTPLTATKWSAEMLDSAKTGALNTAQKKLLHNIYFSNERMIELVNALLNVSRIDMGTFAIEPVPTDILTLTDTLLKDLTLLLKKKKLHLTKKYDQTIPKINLDPQLMYSVLQNLLTNAIKYTPEQGQIKINISQKGKDLNISVADTGYGIPKNQQEKIFTKLFRADNIRTKDTEGTGLGLYVVKSVIDRTGGTIKFKSEENKGSTFYVTMPLSGMKKKEGTKKPTE